MLGKVVKAGSKGVGILAGITKKVIARAGENAAQKPLQKGLSKLAKQKASKSSKLQPWTIREGQEWKAKIFGTGQKTKTDGHAFRSYREAIREAKKEDTTKVFLDRGVNRATENPIIPNRRPDVTVVKKDGTINQIEVPSRSDGDGAKLLERMRDTNNKLPAHQQGTTRIKHITKEN